MAEQTGLLDFLNSPGGMGLLSAVGAGLAGARRGGTLNAIGSGLLGGVQGYAQGQQFQQQQQFNQQRQKLFDSQVAENELQAKIRQQGMDQQQAQRNYISGIGQVTSPVIGAQPNKFDPLKFRALGGSAADAEFYSKADTLGLPEVARTVEGKDAQGNKVTYQFDKFGRPVGEGVAGYTAPVQVDLGGRVQFVTPAAGVNFTKTMSPGERDASARGWANVGLQRDQFAYTKTKDERDRADKLSGGAGSATEDERKAAGWLSQASTAWSNMQKAMGGVDPKTGKFAKPEVAMPGIADAVAAIPSFGLGEVVGNTMRSPERQQFNQASSSMSEAILRAATGAGVTQYEAEQKVRELTPVFGEDPSTTEQKMRAIPVYLDSLKSRAGRAAPKNWSAPVVNAPGDASGWSIRPK